MSAAFPNEPVENVVYSLSRTQSAQTTSEILLDRGSLPAPPAGFAVPEHLRVAVATSSTSPAPSKPIPAKPSSLIERYGLSSRVNEDAGAASAKWEATKEGREADLKARKERMILEARRWVHGLLVLTAGGCSRNKRQGRTCIVIALHPSWCSASAAAAQERPPPRH